MPAFSSISVNDRESTPAAVVFAPQSNDKGVAAFRNSTGVPVGDKIITISTRRTSDKVIVRMKVKDPVVVDETINGVTQPKVSRTAYADVTFSFSVSSSLQERKNAVGYLYGLLGEATSLPNSVLTALEDIY